MGKSKRLHISPFYHNRPNFLRICLSKDFLSPQCNQLAYSAKLFPTSITISPLVSKEAKEKDLPLSASGLSSYDVAARCLLEHGQTLFYGRGGYCRNVPIVQALPTPTDFAVGVELELVFRNPSFGSCFNERTPFSGRHDSLLSIDLRLTRLLGESGALEKYLTYSRNQRLNKSNPDSTLLSLFAKALETRCRYGLLSNWFYFKRDGSLPTSSAELVTIPLPSKIALNPKTWDGLCEYLLPVFNSRSNNACGLHVHTNIGYFFPEWSVSILKKDPDHPFVTTHISIVRLLACYLYGALLAHAPLLLFQIFKRTPGNYCLPISQEQFTEVTNERFLKALSKFSSWARVNASRHKRHLPIYKTLPVDSNHLEVEGGQEKIVASLRSIAPSHLLDRLFAVSPKLNKQYGYKRMPSIKEFIQTILSPLHASIDVDERDPIKNLFDHHSILGLTKTTLEFRQGKGTLNPLEIRTVISFIYAFCSFVKRFAITGTSANMLKTDGKTLVQDFLKYTSHHATEGSLRNLCRLFLARPCEQGSAMIQYPQPNTTSGPSYCCDTRGE